MVDKQNLLWVQSYLLVRVFEGYCCRTCPGVTRHLRRLEGSNGLDKSCAVTNECCLADASVSRKRRIVPRVGIGELRRAVLIVKHQDGIYHTQKSCLKAQGESVSCILEEV